MKVDFVHLWHFVIRLFLACWMTFAAWGQPAPPLPDATASNTLRQALDAATAGDIGSAKALLESGAQAYPDDPRFAVELAGIAFLEKRHSEAKGLLHRARRMGSTDDYVSEFLGTLYLLEGNTEAALALWNGIGKPLLAEDGLNTGFEGILRLALASDVVRFSAGGVLTRNELLRAERNTELLGVCGSKRTLLEAASDGRYKARLSCVERPSFGENRVASLLMLGRGLGYQTVHLRLPNIDGRAFSWNSMLRWDPRKRRVWTETAMPLAGRAGWRLRLDADARHEHWQLLAPASREVRQAFLYRRAEAGIAVAAVLGPRSTWENRVSFANRSFAREAELTATNGVANSRLFEGTSIRYAHSIESDLFRNPMRRVFVTASGEGSFERYLAQGSNVYRGGGAMTIRWLPAASGDDGLTQLRIAAGALRGPSALPELFTIGLERDGGIPLRGHIGTSGGHKGSALYGDRYLSSNLEVQKTLLRLGVVTFALAPFLDVAWVRDPARLYGARRTQFDAGVQWIAATPGGTQIRLSYAWDLRNRRRSFYAYSEPFP
ncbi:MAG: tetratricopeptide repeat protein [Bryobacterales bacterium]|nr:tetratricopeptide repeat protein [Bryobacterales bacterium]